jgi:hypothetical protein
MTNHHSDSSAADEIYRILPMFPMFVGLLTDDVTAEQDRLAVAGQKADAAELDLPYRNVSARLFKRGGPIDNVEIERAIANLTPRTEESAGQKMFLPRRPNEPRFAP